MDAKHDGPIHPKALPPEFLFEGVHEVATNTENIEFPVPLDGEHLIFQL